MAMKRKRILRRFLAPVLILVICVSSFAVTALADDFSNDSLLELVSLGVVNNAYRFNSSNNAVIFSMPHEYGLRYVDFTCNLGFVPTSVTVVGPNGRFPLTVNRFYNSYYRIYGKVDVTSTDFRIEFAGYSDSSWIHIHNFYVRNATTVHFSEVCSLLVDPGITNSWQSMPNANSSVTAYLEPFITDGSILYGDPEFSAYISLDNWKSYDYIDLYIMVKGTGIRSISCSLNNNIYIPCQFTFLDSSSGSYDGGYAPGDGGGYVVDDNLIEQILVIRCDLRGIDRTYNAIPVLRINGDYGFNNSNYSVTVYGCSGYLIPANLDPLTVLFNDLKGFFNDLFGPDDAQHEVIDNATHQQNQLNQTVNVEIVNAVTDWNANVSIVSGGANNAIASSHISLLWLSSLADRIFNNMGWFGNIYFTCGFLAVFLLILSKSGIAGRVKSSFHSSNPKSTSGGSKGNNTSS